MPPTSRATWARTLGVFVAVIVLLGLYVWSALSPPTGPKAITGPMTFDNVTLVTPARSRTEAAAIATRDGHIAAVGKQGTVRVGSVHDEYAGMYVLPGLVDMHSHLPPASALKLTQYFGFLYIAHGVTTIRDAGDLDGTGYPAAIRSWTDEDRAGPRLFRSGPFIVGGDPTWANSIEVHTVEEVRAAVAQLKADGYDCVKSYNDLPVELVHELGRAAEEAGLIVLGHVPDGLRFEDARVRDTQHYMGVAPPVDSSDERNPAKGFDWSGVDDKRMAEVVQSALDHDMANTPTLYMTDALLQYRDYDAARQLPDVQLMPRMFRDVVWSPREGVKRWRNLTLQDLASLESTREAKLELTRRLYLAGARLHIGTDALQPFIVPGAGVLREMEMFIKAGIPPEEVLAIASWKAGEALNRDKLGTLEIDAPADLVIYKEDPTQGLHSLDSIAAVISQGRLYTREEIDEAMAAYQAHFNGGLFDVASVRIARSLLARTSGGDDE